MDNLNKSYEPMDIDLSAHSSNGMDISFNASANDTNTNFDSNTTNVRPASVDPVAPPTPILQPTNIKKFHINIPKETHSHNTSKIRLICAVVILYLSFITYQALNIHCGDDINPEELKRILNHKLYGQFKAIESLTEALSVEERRKILFLYGGTGVGKTFTASLILEHIGRYSNVYHFTMPSFMDKFTTDFMIGLTMCKHSTIIVDDLSAADMEVKAHIKDVVTKSQILDKNITIILIFNCGYAVKDFEKQCDNTFPNALLQNFNVIEAYKKLIKFQPLYEQHLRKCVENELGNRQVSDTKFEKILKNFNVSLDGCKSVHTKMKFLKIS